MLSSRAGKGLNLQGGAGIGSKSAGRSRGRAGAGNIPRIRMYLSADIREIVLLKYRSLIKFQEPPILQGRIHGTELPELGFGHNFRLECTSDL